MKQLPENTQTGRIPPQATDIEKHILGAILIDQASINKILDVEPTDFYNPTNQKIYTAMIHLRSMRKPIDAVTVVEELRREGKLNPVEDPAYITALTQNVSSAANIEYYSRIVLDKALSRHFIGVTTELSNRAWADIEDIVDLSQELKTKLAGITNRLETSRTEHISRSLNHVNEVIQKVSQGQNMHEVEFGFRDLDHILGGAGNGEMVVISGLDKAGKCLGLGTKILMYDGTVKNVEDIIVGDKLMGDDSTPRTVTSLTIGRGKLFKVKLSRSAGSYVCNEDHIMVLKRSSYATTVKQGLRRNGETIELSIKDFVKKPSGFKQYYRHYKVGVDYPQQELVVDPYLLGLWLGDGTSAYGNITSADKEIIGWLQKHSIAKKWKFRKIKQKSKAFKITLTMPKGKVGKGKNFQGHLRMLGLIKNKHIPQEYLINSRSNRLKLLAGLIDTDGYRGGKGVTSILNKDKKFCEQIVFLARSLGLHCTMRSKYNKKYLRYYWIASMSGNLQEIPALLRRKLPKSPWQKEVKRYACEIKPLGVGKYYGFTLDGNGRFLLADYTVTHNTSFTLQVVKANAKKGIASVIYSQEMKASDILLRLAILESKISWLDFQNQRASKDEYAKLNDALHTISKYPIYIDDHNNSINDIEAKTKKLIETYDIKLCVVDYIQIVQGDKTRDYESREREVSDIAMRLKVLAKEGDIPVIALSQLIEDKNGRLSTRESRAIQQHLDKWILIQRDTKKIDMLTLNQNVNIKLVQRMGISEEFGRYKLQYEVSCGAFVDIEQELPPAQEVF